MPVFISAIWGAFVRMIPAILREILVKLGVAVVTYKGIDLTITQYKVDALASLTNMPPEAMGLIAFLKIGQCINIIFSAMLARAAFNGVQNGSIKKFVKK